MAAVPRTADDGGMTLRTRRLRPGDGTTLRAIARDAADFELPGVGEPEAEPSDADADRYLAHTHVLHWVAESGDEVVGELLAHHLPLPEPGDGEVLLYAIGVRTAWRRRGVGRALVAVMTAWMAEHGVRTAWVLADNPGAERFYAACGFTRGGEQEQGVLFVRTVAGAASQGTGPARA